jgi:SAM-dependent methyltransferase
MNQATNLRFEFGRNWESYSGLVSKEEIQEAKIGLQKLLGRTDLKGKRFLDIGSGSGLHALAALDLGAAFVCALDIDPDSVATTEKMLSRHVENTRYDLRQQDILKTSPEQFSSPFDVVYSWGVLHHTGQMHEAMARASRLVAPDGVFAFALYRKTWCCPLWTVEKRWYVQADERRRRLAERVFRLALRARLNVVGRSYSSYVRNYKVNRGMDFDHDVRDWLGGYPYESIAPRDVDAVMTSLGFEPVSRNIRTSLFSRLGLLGSGCDEYVFRRPDSKGKPESR